MPSKFVQSRPSHSRRQKHNKNVNGDLACETVRNRRICALFSLSLLKTDEFCKREFCCQKEQDLRCRPAVIKFLSTTAIQCKLSFNHCGQLIFTAHNQIVNDKSRLFCMCIASFFWPLYLRSSGGAAAAVLWQTRMKWFFYFRPRRNFPSCAPLQLHIVIPQIFPFCLPVYKIVPLVSTSY